MNERILELAEQAGGGPSKWYTDPDVLEKFAELIVRECQDRVEHYIRDCGEIGSLPDTVIMKHFGVEE
jgi:hypothetical protein